MSENFICFEMDTFPSVAQDSQLNDNSPGFKVAEHRLLPSISMLTLAKASSPGIYLFLMEPVTFHSAFCCFSMFPVFRSQFSRRNSLAADLAQKLEKERTQRTQRTQDRGLRGLRRELSTKILKHNSVEMKTTQEKKE